MISWLLMVLSVIGIIVMAVTAAAIDFDPDYMPLLLVVGLASVVQIAMGVGMLKGKGVGLD